jgi:hypothetical protein
MDETPVLRRVWLRLAPVATLFRINTGKGWVGAGKAQRLPNGTVMLPFGRPIALGLSLVTGESVTGTSDLLGFSPIKITAAMVGRILPVLTAFEIKRTDGGRSTTEQQRFVDLVRKAGGIAAIVNSPESAVAAYADFYRQFGET